MKGKRRNNSTREDLVVSKVMLIVNRPEESKRSCVLHHPGSREDRHSPEILVTPHGSLRTASLPSLARLLINKRTLSEWIRAAGRVRSKRRRGRSLQSLRLLRRN